MNALRHSLAIAASLIAFAGPALAREECQAMDAGFDEDSGRIATVTAAKTYFHDEKGHKLKAFVIKGDILLAEEAADGFVCATFISGKGKVTSGYLAGDAVEISEPEAPEPAGWAGDWTTGEWQNLTVKRGGKPGWLQVEGEAYWAASAEAARNGGVNIGNVSSEGPVQDGVLGFTQTVDGSYKPFSEEARDNFDCAIQLKMIGTNYLAVEDSGNCGGHNVSFSGIYARGKVSFDP